MFKYMQADEEHVVGDRPAVFAFIWTYPLINFVVISYTTSSHWVYDQMTLVNINN